MRPLLAPLDNMMYSDAEMGRDTDTQNHTFCLQKQRNTAMQLSLQVQQQIHVCVPNQSLIVTVLIVTTI